MQRLGAYDLHGRFPSLPPIAIDSIVALITIVVATAVRMLIEIAFSGVVVFPLVFPALAVATILAGGRSGLMVVVGCQLLAWYFLVPIRGSFVFGSAGDALGLALATAAELLLLWCVVSYRRAERRATALLHAQSRDLEQTVTLLRAQAEANARLLEQEATLRATRQNLEAIYEASGDGLALCEAFFDDAGHVIEYQALEVNRAHAQLTGATREQMLTNRVSTIHPPIDPRWFETAEKVLKTGIMQDFDIRSSLTGRWLNIRVSRVSDTLFQQTFVDISDRHLMEDQRRALLKEMSHRVMNNFQMIAGFLHIQAMSAEGVASDHLKTAERRVQVLANLHSLLAYTESESDIDAAAYVRELCGYLESAFERPDAVTLSCETDEVRLPTETVVPLGFVVSELVTNAAKYAYPPPMGGMIRVSLHAHAGGWTLTIRDAGRGFDTTRVRKSGGLGTRLVDRFVDQIGAELVTTSDGGVCHRIVYRDTPSTG